MAKRGITAILHQCPRSGADAKVLQKGVELDQVGCEVLESMTRGEHGTRGGNSCHPPTVWRGPEEIPNSLDVSQFCLSKDDCRDYGLQKHLREW